jgi:hypothetical protein
MRLTIAVGRYPVARRLIGAALTPGGRPHREDLLQARAVSRQVE